MNGPNVLGLTIVRLKGESLTALVLLVTCDRKCVIKCRLDLAENFSGSFHKAKAILLMGKESLLKVICYSCSKSLL